MTTWPGASTRSHHHRRETGWDRWQSMFTVTPAAQESGTYEISLDSCPTHLSDGYDQNQQWNVRTLNLMAWADLIRPRAPQPPVRLTGRA